MADQNFDVPLKPFQISNPVVAITTIDLNEQYIEPANDVLDNLFPVKGRSLRTWGRNKNITERRKRSWLSLNRF